MPQGPQYTVRDLVYYMGMFGGIIATVTLSRPAGVHHLISLVLGLIVGAGLGYVSEQLYDRMKSQQQQRRQEQQQDELYGDRDNRNRW